MIKENCIEPDNLLHKIGVPNLCDFLRISPEQEAQLLDKIQNYEQESKLSYLSVFEKLGKPTLKMLSEISSSELPLEIAHLLLLFNKNNIYVKRLHLADNRKYYNFLTEDVMQSQICTSDKFTQFVYEDFYPNHEENVKIAVGDFFNCLLSSITNGYEFYPIDWAQIYDKEGFLVSSDSFSKQLTTFKNQLSAVRLVETSIEEVQLSDEESKAFVNGFVHYVTLKKGKPHQHFSGYFSLQMSRPDDNWLINTFQFPGFEWQKNAQFSDSCLVTA